MTPCRRLWRHVLLLILATGISVTPVRAQGTGTISGVVRDHEGLPLGGAPVSLRDDASGAQRITRTDDHGVYRFDAVESRSYAIEAVFGSIQIERKVFVRPGEAIVVDLLMGPSPSPWALPQSGTLLALVVGTLLTLVITEGGRAALRKLGGPFRWVSEEAYQFFAPRFPELVGLRGYRQRVARSHLAHIENPVGTRDFDIPIERAFVPLRLMGTDRDDRVDAFPFIAEHDRLIVLGGAGTGKTTLMKSVVMSVLSGRSHETLNGLIPVFVVLRDLAIAGHDVEAGIVAAFRQIGFKNADRFVGAAIENGRMLVVLDGLDEVGVNRDAVATRIREFCRADEVRAKRNHVIVTCREASYTTRDLADVIKATTRIEPFTPQHMHQFLQVWPPYRGKS